ncbi:MAG: FKBP-type peptidyl-prolyl cis-trans isomerase [Burkholderiaceae bacterium]|nr:FKBP-type peptidyl-prolyl cis-trans isomerase [Burkholderiaceae bacterium]
MSYIVTEQGVQYLDIRIGTGREINNRAIVDVHYTGWLQNEDGSVGKKFDSSHDRGETFTFPMGVHYVIPGWERGMKGMKEGGMRRLIIPPMMAYAAVGVGDVIPPNATLIFEIELLSV